METSNLITVNSITGDLRQGGSIVSATLDGDTDLVEYGQNIRLPGKSFSDFDDMNFREFFNGHVLGDPSYDFDALTSQAKIRIGTANYLMMGGRLQYIGFTEQTSPANDHQIAPTMRISSCFNHVVERHCNFIFNATTMPDGIITETDIDTADTAIGRINVKNKDFWGALQGQLGGGEEGGVQFYRPWFNRRNKLFYQSVLGQSATSKGTLTKEHLRGRVRVSVRNATAADQVGQVQIVAVQSANTILEAKFPALLPGDGKIVVKDNGIWADTQARADVLAEALYDWLTRPYTLTVQVDAGLILFGDDGLGLDLGDKIAITYDGPAEDTATGAGVHLEITDQEFWVYGYNVNFDTENRTARPATLELEANN
jgi:hypothetical protein